jgi:hypothetical protein
MSDKEFKAKTAIFQAKFMELFEAHAALLSGDTAESKSYNEYIERLGAIKANDSLTNDEQNDQLDEEQDFGPMSYVADDLAGDDHDLRNNLHEAMSRVELMTALVNCGNNAPKKPRARKARAAAAA